MIVAKNKYHNFRSGKKNRIPEMGGIFLFTAAIIFSCANTSSSENSSPKETASKIQQPAIDTGTVYKTKNLVIKKLSENIYEHTSFLSTKDFGKVDCNGMIVVNQNEAVVFDTPADDEASQELINYLVKELHCKIIAVIPTHFHEDCVGGLEKFNEHNIPAYASFKTIEMLKTKDRNFSKPIQGFNDTLTLSVGNEKVLAQYFGEGHTRDNVIGYFPAGNAVFGGCLIKETGAGKGNLADANVAEWSETVRRIKKRYPGAAIVIPGHGKTGTAALFDYTIKLFE